jgi:TonB family protein
MHAVFNEVLMKRLASFIAAVALSLVGSTATALAQAGRHGAENPKATFPVPLPDESVRDSWIKRDSQDQTLYQCLDAGGQAAAETADQEIFSGKDVTEKARILAKPEPTYTLEARRNGTNGRVRLRVVLSSAARVTSVKVIKELPDGLTEMAVKAACRIRFKPALKDGLPVSQYVLVEYGFMTNLPIGARTRMPPPPRP